MLHRAMLLKGVEQPADHIRGHKPEKLYSDKEGEHHGEMALEGLENFCALPEYDEYLLHRLSHDVGYGLECASNPVVYHFYYTKSTVGERGLAVKPFYGKLVYI